MSENFVPVTTLITPSVVTPGSTAEIMVTISGTTQVGQNVALSSSNKSFFSNLPSSLFVPVGKNSAEINVQVASNAAGSAVVTASCNGGSASATCSVL